MRSGSDAHAGAWPGKENMMTEREKQLNGDWFDYNDPELKEMRTRCNKLIARLNSLDNSRKEDRRAVLKELFAQAGENANIKSGFHCDYGCNIYLENNVFSNYNCVFLDVGRIEIGDDTLIGPQVGIYGSRRKEKGPGESQARKNREKLLDRRECGDQSRRHFRRQCGRRLRRGRDKVFWR